MVFLNLFIRQIHVVNEDDVDAFKMTFQILDICLHQFGFTGTTNACNNLDVGSAVQFNDPIEIFGPRNCFHIAARFQNLNFFRFLKPLCCSYYTVCKEYMQDAGFKIVNFFIF